MYPKSTELPSGRLVASFEDSEGSVVGQKLPIYKSDDHGDTWQKLSDVLPPASLSSDPAYAAYTSNWTNPYFYVLPQDLGSLKAGTLLLASVVSGPDQSTNGSNRTPVAIALYESTDSGQTWNVVNIIASGPNQAQDPVWEPYLMMYQGQLVAYYSDENDYLSYNTTTGAPTLDPNNATATDSGGQILAHKTWNGTGFWSTPVVDVAGPTQDMGGGKTEIGYGRPGMTNVVPTSDGKWMLTYEYWGGGDNVRYKIADDPLKFYSDNNAAGNPISSIPVTPGSNLLAQGGSPVLVRLPDGRIAYNAAGSSDLWVNDSGSSTGSWKEYHTSMPAGYSRNLQYVTATGRIEILTAPWGTGPVSYGQVDIGNSKGVYYSLINRKTGQALSPQAGKTQDAQFTGNIPDITGLTRNDANASQWWHLARKGNSVTLLNKTGGRAMGIWQGNAVQGGQLAQWVDDGGSDKLWNLVSTVAGYVKIQSTANTSLYATSATAGSVDLEAATTDTGQQWQLVVDFTTTADAAFKLVDHGSGKVLGINAGSTADGAAAVQWSDTGASDQAWKIGRLANGSLTFTDQNSSKVLSIQQASTSPGAAAVQSTGTGASSQQWSMTPSGPYYTIKNSNSQLLLGIQGGSTADGAPAIQWTPDGSANQQWQLVQVAGD
ncbi:RICIN domain-containing protein [Pseudarthrobacter phenanthrenivorans]|uniref:RICIN domain-containing protein n=1 Tax=Pseudarthrobacter phenanthrenivorans TaxID=361575 RepID=UPI002F352D12